MAIWDMVGGAYFSSVEFISESFWDRTVAQKAFLKMAPCPFLERRRGKDLEKTGSFFLCGGSLLAWPKSHRYPPQSSTRAVSLLSAGMKPYPQANTADSLAVYFAYLPVTTTRVCWHDAIRPKWLPLESQLPAVIVPSDSFL